MFAATLIRAGKQTHAVVRKTVSALPDVTISSYTWRQLSWLWCVAFPLSPLAGGKN
jgi:hypothetical protein